MAANNALIRPNETDVGALVKDLSSADRARRARAEEALRELAASGVEPLLAVMEEGKRLRKRHVRRILWIAGSLLLLYCLLIVLTVWLWPGGSTGFFGGWGSFIGPMAGALAGAGFMHNRVARLLAEQDDVRAVPPLLEALGSGDRETKRIAGQALSRLLPR